MNKRAVINYFDGLVSEMEYQVEQFVIANRYSNNKGLCDKINMMKDRNLREINECLEYDLLMLKDDQGCIEIPFEWIFERFCFQIKIPQCDINDTERFDYRLVSTNKYLTKAQIESMQVIINFMPGIDHMPYSVYRRRLEKLVFNIKADPICEYEFEIKNISGVFDNMIKSNWTSLDMIKASSEQLLSFTELKTNCTILSIRPDAKYLFSHLQKLTRTKVSISDISDVETNLINLKRVDEFKEASTEIERLYITHYGEKHHLDQHQIMTNAEFVMQTLEGQKIKALEFDKATSLEAFLQLTLRNINAKKSIWPYLTDLRIFESRLDFTKWKLFDLFPKLDHLQLGNNNITTISKTIFTNARNLAVLDLKDNFETMEKDSLRGLDSLKVLKINAHASVYEFESGFGSDNNKNQYKCKDFECFYDTPKPNWDRFNRLDYPVSYHFPLNLEELHLSNFAVKSSSSPYAFVNLPPKLKVLTLSKFSIESSFIGPNTFKQLIHLDQFEIRNSQISSFETSMAPKILNFINFNNSSVVKLNADASRISKIEEIYHDCEDTSVSVSRNELYLESKFNMTGLRKLNIEPNHAMQFHNMTNLQELYLKLRGMAVLEDGKFRCLPNLKILEIGFYDEYYMEKNENSKLEQKFNGDVFTGLVSLQKLSFSLPFLKQARQLKSNIFKHLINVESITFRGSSIGSIQPGTFSFLLKLKQLDLGANKLKKISLNEMKRLEVLKLDNNEIVSIEELFESMKKQKNTTLKELGLQCNRLGKLEADSFACVPSLETLRLSNNTILTISAQSFNGLNNLKVLDISRASRNKWPRKSDSFDENEPLLHLEDNTFSSLSSLRSLTFKKCKIQTISNQTFNGLVNLHSLDFSYNNLRQLDDNVFSFVSSLANLDLSNNKLETISKSAFNGLFNLIEVNLSLNELVSIDMCTFFNSDLERLTRLNLNSQKLKVIDLSDSKAECSHLKHQLVVQVRKSSQVQICSLLDELVEKGVVLFE